MTKKSEKRESIMSYAYQPAIKEIEKGLCLLMMRLKADGKEFLLTERTEEHELSIDVTLWDGDDLHPVPCVVKGIKVDERGDLYICINIPNVCYTLEDLIDEFGDENSEHVYCLYKDGKLFTGDMQLDTDLVALVLLRSIDDYYV